MHRFLAAALIAVITLAGIQSLRLSAEREGHANTKRAHAEAVAKAIAEAREEERRRTVKVQEAADAALAALARAHRDRTAAVSAARRLQQHADSLAAACRAPAAASGEASPAPGDLLADMLRRIDDAAGAIAAHADEARIAGAACERAYDSLTR
jgi:hypothetical protein